MTGSVSKKFKPSFSSPYYFIRRSLYKKIRQFAPQLQGRLLDFGCGTKPYQGLFTNVSEYIGLILKMKVIRI
jgi:hypothetical protein